MSQSFKKGDNEANFTQCDINITNLKKDVEIKNEPLEQIDDWMGKKEFNEEEGIDTSRNIDMKKEIKVKKDPGESNYDQKPMQIPKNEDVEMKVEEEIYSSMEDDSENESEEKNSDACDQESEDEDLIGPYVSSIKNGIELIGKLGTFACGGIMDKAKMKQIYVKGVGKLEIPLSYRQAEVLKSKCAVAPFGKGSETLVDKLVRDAWQIDAKDVTVGKKFDKFKEEYIAEIIIPTLMGESITENYQVESELNKLVYYEKGGHFVAHRNTEKAPGMFATLVIQLPAGHEGGELIVRHNEETKVFDFEYESRNNFYFTAFFADCEHELKKIIGGHQLVLIYNLICKNSQATLQPNDDNIKLNNNQNFITIMKKSVKEWESDDKGPEYLTLKLDHLYTGTNISFQNLKGKDKTVADTLCLCPDIQVYLATITKTVFILDRNPDRNEWDDYPDEGEEEDYPDEASETAEYEKKSSYKLRNWMDVNHYKPRLGERKLRKKEMLIKENIFMNYGERCEAKYTYPDNAGCDYFYKARALVFMPKSHEISILFSANINSALAKCKKLVKSKKMDDALEMLKGILSYVIKSHTNSSSLLQDSDNVTIIFEIMILFGDKIKYLANPLLLALARSSKSGYRQGKIGLPNKSSAVALANLINILGWDSLRVSVLQLVKESAECQIESCVQLVNSLLKLGLYDQAISIVGKIGLPNKNSAVALANLINILGWDSLRVSVLQLVKESADCQIESCVQLVNSLLKLGLYDQAISIVEVAAPQIIEKTGHLSIEGGDFQTIFSNLQDNGWKNLTLKSVIVLWPAVLFVDKINCDISLIDNFVKAVMEHKDSSEILEALLEIPIVIETKDNPSVQLIVQKRIQQLDIPNPVFSWAMPNAQLSNYFNEKLLDKVNNFLRSDKKTITIEGAFQGKKEADKFCQKYFSSWSDFLSQKYSAKYENSGVRKKVKCTIIKTKHYFNAEVKHYNFMLNKSKNLKEKFCE
ncbi:unnamed protein product, partial [Meganyctiphanes norvegica]